jgi:hypothetical protein
MMRPGDQLRVSWVAGNDSDNLRMVGYHNDELRLHLHLLRGRIRIELMLEHRTGPDNPSRMIRQVPVGQVPEPAPITDLGPYLDVLRHAVARHRHKAVSLVVSTNVADRLAGPVELPATTVTVFADAARFDDEVSVLDRHARHTLAHGYAAQAAVRAAGSNAVEVYRSLRADGLWPQAATAAATTLVR